MCCSVLADAKSYGVLVAISLPLAMSACTGGDSDPHASAAPIVTSAVQPADPTQPVLSEDEHLRSADVATLGDEFRFDPGVTINAPDYGMIGDGVTDNTIAFQNILAGGNRTIRVPAGDYVTHKVSLQSGTVLILERGVTIRDAGRLALNERLINIRDIHAVRIVGFGARIVSNRPVYDTGEQRHGVYIFGSARVVVDGLESSSHGGDGFYIGGPSGNPSTDIVLKRCSSRDNRRQGLSITSARRVRVVDCSFSETVGTAPQYGIDLEPNHRADVLDRIFLVRPLTHSNTGGGIMIWLRQLDATSEPVAISVLDHNSYRESPIFFKMQPDTVAGTIRYTAASE